VARVTCNECGSEASAGTERCPRCGAPLPVLFGTGAGVEVTADSDATVVTASVPRGPAEPGDRIAGRFQPVGEPRADLWGSFVRARDTARSAEVTLYRLERGVFRTRDDIERFRAAQQDLIGLSEPVLALPAEVVDAGGQYYLVYRERLAGTLRDAEPAAPFRGTDPEHVRRMLGFLAEYIAVVARLGPRGLHLGLRPSVVFVLGRELKVAQLGFCTAFPPELVRRRHAHDGEARFYTAPEVLQQGRGSTRADLYSLALIVGYAISGRERTPQLRGFQPHPAFAELFRKLAAADETQRLGDLRELAASLASLVALPTVISAPRGAAVDSSTEGTAEVDVGEIEAVEEPADNTGEIVEADLEAVAEGEASADRTGEISAAEVHPVEAGGIAASTPTDDSWSAPPQPAPQAPAARRDLGPGAVRPDESDGSIDPRLLRAAVRSDAEKGIGAKAKAVDLLRRDAAKGDARARKLLMDAAARMPARPSAAPPAPAGTPPAAAPAARKTLLGVPSAPPPAPPPAPPAPAARPSASPMPPRTVLGMPSPVGAPPPAVAPGVASVPPGYGAPSVAPGVASVPPGYSPPSVAPGVASVPPGYGPPPQAMPPAPGIPPGYAPRPGTGGPAAGYGSPGSPGLYPAPAAPPPAVALPMTVPSTQTLPTSQVPTSQVPVLPGPAVSAPTVPVVTPLPAAAAARVSTPAAAPGWPPVYQGPSPAQSALPVAPAPAAPASAPPRVTGPAPLEIPSSVVGPDLVVRGGPAKKPVVAMDVDDAESQTGRAEPVAQGPLPVLVRKVPRPMVDEQDLPPTEAWTPRREEEPAPKPPGRGGFAPTAPLFDDSYKQTGSEVFDEQQLPQPVDRSMDLIWWSLAIAGALVLVALLITFK